MKMLKQMLPFLLMFLLTGCGMRQRTVIIKEPFAHQSALSACSGSFDNFAFSTPDIDSDSQKHFLPMPPWVQADSIPAQENGFGYHVEAVTLYGDQKQIWVRAGMINPNYLIPGSMSDEYWVYQPSLHQWRSVSTHLKDTNLIVDKVFLVGDMLWGRVSMRARNDDKSFPSLAWYEPEENMFYPAQNSELPAIQTDSQVVFVYPYHNDSVLIVREHDAIYQYNTSSQIVEKIKDISDLGQIFDPVLSTEGILYIKRMETAGVISKDGLLTYDPLTGIVDSLPLPDQQIPLAGSLYIDNDQQLWTGIFGWFDKDFTWNAFHPEIDQYVVVDKTIALWRYFLPASLIFESSDGRLWFAIPSNSGSANLRSGMAWFDPITKEGCWFSSQGTRIVEDGDQSLWMTAGQSLYYLNLEPRE